MLVRDHGGEHGAPAASCELAERLWLHPASLEPGFVAVERDIALDEQVTVDLLGRDDDGRPVLVLSGDGELPRALGRAVGVVAAFQRCRLVLGHFLASAGLDVKLPVRVVLLAARFDDPRALGLEPVLAALGAELREAAEVALPDAGHVLHLSDPRAALTNVPARVQADVAVGFRHGAAAIERDVATTPAAEPQVLDSRLELAGRRGASAECRRLYVAASESIRSLSSVVESDVEDDSLVCRVEGERLVTLVPQGDHLDVCVGQSEQPDFEVSDDAGLNASLNAVFSHYFQNFSGRR